MQTFIIQQYVLSLYGKDEWDAKDLNHPAHDIFLSVTQKHIPIIYERSWKEKMWEQVHVCADAIISHIRYVNGVGVYMADCNNIAILWQNWYAVVHGSWKTLHAWLLEKTIFRLIQLWESSESLHIFIWPSIRTDAYEVWNEFRDLFEKNFLPRYWARYHLDMIAYIYHILQKFNIESTCLTLHKDCTFNQNDRRRSYRRGEKGRRNFLWVRPQKKQM